MAKKIPIVITPVIKLIIDQGIIIPPVHKTGKISNIEINKAIITELSTPIKVKPIANSIKVIDIIII